MANNQIISTIKVDTAADNGKYPVYNSTTKVFDMTTPSGGGNPGWDFVSYNTATAASSITVSGLNINTDGGTYMVIVQAAGTATCDYTMQFGSETAAYTWGINRISTAGGAFSFGTDSSTSSSGILLAGSAADVKSMQGRIMLYEGLKFDGTNTQITAEYTVLGTGTGASNDAYERNDGVGITENIESTLTAFTLLASGGATPNWKVWVFKAATS